MLVLYKKGSWAMMGLVLPLQSAFLDILQQILPRYSKFAINPDTFSKCFSPTTWSVWNLLIAVGVLRSLGQELDPVLDFGHPGIHAVAGALAAVTHHSNLRKSK